MISTKAKTLVNLKDRLSKFIVPKTLIINVKDWKEDYKKQLSIINNSFDKNSSLAIRSSAVDEDKENIAKAGEYESVLSVPINDSKLITVAINKVVSSYKRNKNQTLDDEIFIQTMVENNIMSGVVFTHDLNTGAPYYVINYDDISGLTNTVTSGSNEYSNRTLYVHRSSKKQIRSKRFKVLIDSIKELEKVLDNKFLDIEFSITQDLDPYLLQVRAITTKSNWNRLVSKEVTSSIKDIEKFIKTRFKKIDGVYGEKSIFGQMPDWNPAEMIGRAPNALSFSLYEKLITDSAWRDARDEMGYQIPEGHPLMVSLHGQPFIDARLSFHSYLPKSLDKNICNKVVNHWINQLKENPEFHDKIEFEIAITTFSFDFDEKLKSNIGNILNRKEQSIFKKAYKEQAVKLISGKSNGSIRNAMDKVNILDQKLNSFLNNYSKNSINNLSILIEDCIKYGTIPFSILARHGFIAKTILLSLINKSIISKTDMDDYLNSLDTVATELVGEIQMLNNKKITREKFMQKYGHLRPGTYDIKSKCYNEMDDVFSSANDMGSLNQKTNFTFKSNQIKKISKLIEDNKLSDIKHSVLIKYLSHATTGREYSKFIFTRTVSTILEIIANYGKSNSLSRDELAHVPIDKFINLAKHSVSRSIEDYLRSISVKNNDKARISASLRLPQVLFDTAGLYVIPFQVSTPNFVTNKIVNSKCYYLKSSSPSSKLKNKIILIDGADPGFDWIFSHNISGLITKYGGANSHMSIRCAEFGIPAAIGCGEQRFDMIKNSSQLLLDCSSSLIEKIT